MPDRTADFQKPHTMVVYLGVFLYHIFILTLKQHRAVQKAISTIKDRKGKQITKLKNLKKDFKIIVTSV